MSVTSPAKLAVSAQFGRARWALHRASVKKGIASAWPQGAAQRWLFISVDDPISTAQIFPFFFFSRSLRRAGIEVREITLQDFQARTPYSGQVDMVWFQTWFDLSGAQLEDLVARLRAAYPGAALAYLDWFAPTDLRFAATLGPLVDFYVKKQILRDRAAYGRPTLGDTNLTDHYARRLNISLDPVLHEIPETFWPKLVLGPNFAFTSQILQLFRLSAPPARRSIHVHARIAVKGTPWYTAMRQEALAAAKRLQDVNMVCEGRVSRKEYMRELFDSQICFSPFGYGEVCWRDYEAVLCGALLIKPDMSHIQTEPDIFRPYETYVPVRWDLADLEETVRHYLGHPEESAAITRRALAVIHDYLAGGGFWKQMDAVFRLGKPAAGVTRLECGARV